MVLVDHGVDLERIQLPGTEPVQRPADMLEQLAEPRFVIRRHTISSSLPFRL
ncbi:hypothetical protein AB0H49_20655 [Nocardia sp. NPDC050713]|uniref:hypothetical protein n=1 Tax=Nocardia sp. NPDC050713 TaxID=3154511 RepID=UPI003405C931